MRSPLGSQLSQVFRQAELQNQSERDRLAEIAKQLRSVTERVAANVDAHQTKMQEVSDGLGEGEPEDDATRVCDVVTQLIEANAKMQEQLQDAQSQLRDQAQAIETAQELALTDGLTGLSNRRALDLHLQQRYAIDDTEGHPTTFMLIDVDHFKKFNDVYGHRTGDEVLKHVGKTLTAGLSELGFVARYGGEEFAVVFNDFSVTDIMTAADEVRDRLGKKEIIFDGQSLRITASAGLAQLQPEDTIDGWIERADSALYTAKDEGRNRAYWMDGDIAFPVREDETEDAQQDKSVDPSTSEASTVNAESSEAANGADADQSSEDQYKEGDSDQCGLENLPDLNELSESTLPVFERLQAERIPFCLIAIHVHADGADDGLRVALSSIHASVRGIDAERIGYDGHGLFIICLPSADESVACERAEKIRSMIDTARDEDESRATWDVQIAAQCAKSTENFESVLQRTIEAVQGAAAVEASI
ncbi:MAG: GGDEF domain-containing protein [Pirellulaceae bacterium]